MIRARQLIGINLYLCVSNVYIFVCHFKYSNAMMLLFHSGSITTAAYGAGQTSGFRQEGERRGARQDKEGEGGA